jgi:D-alanyl-lipoteichoic acid acyltransferase DltB (MBOAT superfamily)
MMGVNLTPGMDMDLLSLDFTLFMLVVLFLNWVLPPHGKVYRLFLLSASYVFYGSLNLKFLLILLHFSAWTWLLGLGIARSGRPWLRKGLLTFHLIIGIGGLVFFKYYDLLYETVTPALAAMGAGALLPDMDIAVPVGISFFTFQGVSYVVDTFRAPQRVVRNPLELFIYLSFFPTILSGPIMRAADFIPQIGKMRLDRSASNEAFSLILSGLAKKLVISSYLYEHVVQPVFRNPDDYSSLAAAVGALGYSIQILCDFSGYTDLVRGIAMLMGYSVPMNFDNPYSARNLKEFWHRWHMTLSTWLRDYLYIPLGGNRGGLLHKYLNIFITMTLGGLWHGASWNFLFWGCFHGFGLVVTHLFTDMGGKFAGERSTTADHDYGLPAWCTGCLKRIGDGVSWLLTFVFVTIGWVFFGTANFEQAMSLLKRILVLDPAGNGFSECVMIIVPVLIAVILLHEVLRMRVRLILSHVFQGLPLAAHVVLLTLLIGILLKLAPDGVPQFIYYQF